MSLDKLKLSLDKSRIPKLSDTKKVIARTRTDKGKKISRGMVETRSQKLSEGQKAMLEVEVHQEPTVDENRDGYGPEGRGNRRLTSESSPVKQGQDLPLPPGL